MAFMESGLIRSLTGPTPAGSATASCPYFGQKGDLAWPHLFVKLEDPATFLQWKAWMYIHLMVRHELMINEMNLWFLVQNDDQPEPLICSGTSFFVPFQTIWISQDREDAGWTDRSFINQSWSESEAVTVSFATWTSTQTLLCDLLVAENRTGNKMRSHIPTVDSFNIACIEILIYFHKSATQSVNCSPGKPTCHIMIPSRSGAAKHFSHLSERTRPQATSNDVAASAAMWV